ncbi:hypothetical protein TraAM80_04077 [Trypanosoma rangeli]|uniref:Uncharacterized protein n=1 Tax=Trypanosoma rangeli TaxID=5698 RepID=A0A422NL65_TRYRA|nr:uncharacterized protein TraAM80_04077 [Trypanosoma rangeli]RNF06186.1 hypothetical protein TraAM80_04077 [Trypanosoma rangeli]|eukprot:RNF06186.1 hypothetical protein TraAM80_04077 [Trypanosoma rangeli]
MHSGQVFHFVDPVHCLSSCESSVGEARDRMQEHLCESMIENRTLHARHGALFYHVEVPYTVESTVDSPDAVKIPVTVHCRSLAAHPLLVTVETTTPGCPNAAPSSMSSSVPVVFVGKSSAGFLLLPHENYSLSFTACAFAPGVAECNLFKVSAVALQLPPLGNRGVWQTGTSRGALMTWIGETTSCLGAEPGITARVGGESSGSGGGGSNCSGSGRKQLGCVSALVYDSIRIVVLGHGMAAMTRVLFVSLSQATMRAAAEAVAARMQPYHEEAKRYERQCKVFEQRRALLGTPSAKRLQKKDALLALYPPRAHKLVETVRETPFSTSAVASSAPTWKSDTSLLLPHRGITGNNDFTGAAVLEAVAVSPSSSDWAVEVDTHLELQGLRDITMSRGESSRSETGTSSSSTTSRDESV